MQFRQLLGAACVLMVAATGCGGSDDDDPGPQTTVTRFPPTMPVNNQQLSEGNGACGFVNQGEVQAAVGSPVNAGSGTRTQTGEACRWTLRSNVNHFVSVILSPTGRAEFDRLRAAVASPEPISGVGDQAFVTNDTAYALKGDRFVILQVATNQPIAARKQAAIRLVTSAAPRI